jgi:hypothetical protein
MMKVVLSNSIEEVLVVEGGALRQEVTAELAPLSAELPAANNRSFRSTTSLAPY